MQGYGPMHEAPDLQVIDLARQLHIVQQPVEACSVPDADKANQVLKLRPSNSSVSVQLYFASERQRK